VGLAGAAITPVPTPSPEQWRLVKGILHAALEQPSSERAAFVARACCGDLSLQHEVESLIVSIEGSGAFLERPASAAGALALERRGADSPQLARCISALGDRYQFERELVGGGMSLVFLAEERALGRRVVVKVLSPEETHGASAERFAREVRLAARLQQANIVPVLSAGEVDGLAFYTMPYVQGESLRERLSLGTATSIAEVLGMMRDVAKALAYAHAQGIVHRDIKPENVLISGGTAVVTDFGIAKALSAARADLLETSKQSLITPSGIAVGTPAYMAPEQAAGDPAIAPSADVYALGVMIYELLAGAHPFAGRRGYAEMMAAHVLELPPPLFQRRPDVPAAIAELVMRCLAKDPRERPRDGQALLSELDLLNAASLGARRRIDTSSQPSVAVLPLANLSGDPENEYFSDGIAAEVLFNLAHIPGVRVAARTSSFAFKGQSVDLRTIADALGVHSLVEGSVRRAGSRVRISVQLVRAIDNSTLWQERFDREIADIFTVQEEIAQSIARALAQTLAGARDDEPPAPSAIQSRHGVVDPQAFELYLRGRHLLEQRADGMQEALRCFDAAVKRAPDFSAPYAGMSTAFILFGIYHALRPRDAFPKAREAAERALALDANDAFALVMRAHVALWHEWDFDAAERDARRALDLAPGLYLAHSCLGYVLAARGEFEAAIAAMQNARALDPLSENATFDLAWVLVLASRWSEALRELEPALARHPRTTELRRVYGFCLFYAGRRDEGRAEFRRVLELKGDDTWGSLNLVQALAALGEFDEAHRRLSEIERRAPSEPIPPLGIAIMHHWLGNDEQALDWLNRSVEARDYWLVMLPFDPSMSRLRGNPRFDSIVRRVRGSTA